MNTKRFILDCRFVAALALMALAGTTLISAQETKKDEVTLSDVVIALEKINTQLENEDKDTHDSKKSINLGGGPRFDFRYFLDMGSMNAYMATRGNYTPFASYFLPMVNSGGGTWRIILDKNWQIGWNTWGGGFSSLGYRTANPVDTIDQDADGFDDYHTYASYGINVNDFLLQYKVAVVPKTFFVGIGGMVGLGSESFSIEQNTRTLIDGFISAYTASSDWTRSLLDTSAYLTLQFQPNKDSAWFKLSLNAGFDYPIAMGAWMPSAGVHKTVAAPPAGFKSMNAWVGLGLDFNL